MRLALTEDVGGGDATTDALVDASVRTRARIVAKQEGVMAGTSVATLAFRELDPAARVAWAVTDGGAVKRGDRVAEIEGQARAILTAERVALNFLQRLSGIATLTRAFVKAVEGTGVKILDTRKTTPGLRLLEKFAVMAGGGENHRFGLFDGILVKENHVLLAGGLRQAIERALAAAREKKIPVVVSMGNVAASGGYWVSTPGDFVFAEPSTITGSIGVFGVLPSFEGTLTKLGLGADGVKTTPLSGEPDLLKGPSPEADALIQAGVEQVYRKFLAIVSEARRKSPADIDRIGQGRVWDGGSTRQLGLVDGFGGMDEAIAKAAELAKLGEDERRLTYLEKEPDFTDTLLMAWAGEEDEADVPADALASLAPAPETMLARALTEVRSILSGPTIQVRCLECPPVSVAPKLTQDDRSWVARLLGWS